jgi:single-strand DNA-binding protein
MADMNRVFLIGNLTRDPEVRYAPSGDAVGDLQMAVGRRYKTRDGQDKEETCFVGVVVWGRQAETCGEYLKKGSPVLIEGRLQYDQWEKDGQKQSRLRVRAERVQFLSRGRSDEAREPREPRESREAREEPPPERGPERAPAPAEESGPPVETGDDDNLPF